MGRHEAMDPTCDRPGALLGAVRERARPGAGVPRHARGSDQPAPPPGHGDHPADDLPPPAHSRRPQRRGGEDNATRRAGPTPRRTSARTSARPRRTRCSSSSSRAPAALAAGLGRVRRPQLAAKADVYTPIGAADRGARRWSRLLDQDGEEPDDRPAARGERVAPDPVAVRGREDQGPVRRRGDVRRDRRGGRRQGQAVDRRRRPPDRRSDRPRRWRMCAVTSSTTRRRRCSRRSGWNSSNAHADEPCRTWLRRSERERGGRRLQAARTRSWTSARSTD